MKPEGYLMPNHVASLAPVATSSVWEKKMEAVILSLNKLKRLPENSSSKPRCLFYTCEFEGTLRFLCVFRQLVNPVSVINNHSASYFLKVKLFYRFL